MAGQINDREHMTLARTNKTPALHAIVEVKSSVTVQQRANCLIKFR